MLKFCLTVHVANFYNGRIQERDADSLQLLSTHTGVIHYVFMEEVLIRGATI